MAAEELAVSDFTDMNGDVGALRSLPGLLWARAHHEAAHAVVATLMGGRVEEIELWSGPPVGGRVRLTGLDASSSGTDGYDVVRRIVYLLAGPISEHIAETGPAAILNEAASMVATAMLVALRDPATIELHPDVQAVVGLVQDHFGPENEAGAAAAVDHLAMHVENYVRDQWAAIQGVAARLLRHGTLSGDDLQSFLSVAISAPDMAALLDAFPS
jgi:hypothetical protein